jgi:hypothetical protein
MHRLSLSAAIILFCHGCTVDPMGRRLATGQPAVGQPAKISIVAANVMRWDEIANDLQKTQFELTYKELLDQAVTTSSSTSFTYQDRLVASLQAAIAGTNISRSAQAVTDAAGTVTSTSSDNRTRMTPEVPDNYTFNFAAPELPDGGSGTTGVEAQTRMRVAAALAEEMAILNKRVTGIAVPKGYRPYFVSLQLAMLPERRGLPYDTEIDLNFDFNDSSAPENAKEPVDNRRPEVLPMLVTDAIEGTHETDIQEIVRQLGVGLAGSGGFFGGSANLERTLRSLNQSVALRLNNLLSVTPNGPSSITVRIGANRFGSAFEMVPRNRFISLVVLVPKERVMSPTKVSPKIQITGSARFRDAMWYKKHGPFSDPASSMIVANPFSLPTLESAQCPPLQNAVLSSLTGGGEGVMLSGATGLALRNIEAHLVTPKFGEPLGKMTLVTRDVQRDKENLLFRFPTHSQLRAVKSRQLDMGYLTFSVLATDESSPSEALECSGGDTGKVRGYPVAYLFAPAVQLAASAKPAAAAKPAEKAKDAAEPVAPKAEAPAATDSRLTDKAPPVTLPF